MKQQRIILVAKDFSKSSTDALNYVVNNFKHSNVKILLVHAIQTDYRQNSIKNLLVEDNYITKKNIEDKLKKMFLEVMERNNLDYEFEIISKWGMPTDVILETIDEVKPFFVVLGVKKSIRPVELLFGNTTLKIAEQTRCPVIIIPEGLKYSKIKRIIFATDYHTRDIGAIKNLSEHAREQKIPLIVLHISDGELTRDFEETMLTDFKKKINEQVNYANIIFQLVEAANVEEELKKYVTTKTDDLFALSTGVHGFFNTLFRKSITAKMLHETKVPLVAYHSGGELDVLY